MQHILWNALQARFSHPGQRKENIFNISIPILVFFKHLSFARTNHLAEFLTE